MNDGRETASQDHPKQGQGTGIEASKAGARAIEALEAIASHRYSGMDCVRIARSVLYPDLYPTTSAEVRPQPISEPADDGCCVLCGLSMSTPTELDPTEVCNECAQAFYANHAAQPISEQGSDRVLRIALEKAADTFEDLKKVCRLLGRDGLAESCRVAEEGTRAALATSEREA